MQLWKTAWHTAWSGPSPWAAIDTTGATGGLQATPPICHLAYHHFGFRARPCALSGKQSKTPGLYQAPPAVLVACR